MRIKAVKGMRYQLVDPEKQADAAPDEVKTRRSGNNLELALDEGTQVDVVIEEYYTEMPLEDGGLIGRGEDGLRYTYLPEDPVAEGFISALPDQAEWVYTALGSEQITGAGAAVGVRAVNPLSGAAGDAGAAGAAGGASQRPRGE